MREYPDTICGPRLTDKVMFVCWRDRLHDGPHLSFMMPDFGQVMGLLLDVEGRIVQPHDADIDLVEENMKRFLEFVHD